MRFDQQKLHLTSGLKIKPTKLENACFGNLAIIPL